jgi:glycosyltransferase involved in cell wall biosynthesis
MPDLSVLIPARNEMFLAKTVECVLNKMRADTEVIVVFDGQWAVPGFELPQHDKVTVLFNAVSRGQRAATNQAAKLSTAKYIMKLDAHCDLDEGFDVKLMEDCEYDWTVIPKMYNLHAFDWVCNACRHRTYQGPTPTKCTKCGSEVGHKRDIIWQPRLHRMTDAWRFDRDLHFQYWGAYKTRPEAKGDIVDVMCNLGACWFLHRERYWDLGGLDEKHGSWGQMGVEISCKSWLSGGRQVVNKKTWYSHMFRTQGGDFGFPYPNSGSAVEKARSYSKDLWQNDKWPQAKRPFRWIIDHFAPVPGWEDLTAEKGITKGIAFYTDSVLDEKYAAPVRQRLKHSINGHELVSVSLKPLDFGTNVVLPLKREALSMFRQIVAALEHLTTDVVFLCEHDVLYHPSHFEFMPARKDVYYYNENTYKVDVKTGQAVFYYTKQTSGLCAYRDLLLQHYRARIDRIEREGLTTKRDFEPGCHRPPRGIDSYTAERWMAPFPNVDLRHKQNLTMSRWDASEFRDPKACEGFKLVDEIPGWGVCKGRFDAFVRENVK